MWGDGRCRVSEDYSDIYTIHQKQSINHSWFTTQNRFVLGHEFIMQKYIYVHWFSLANSSYPHSFSVVNSSRTKYLSLLVLIGQYILNNSFILTSTQANMTDGLSNLLGQFLYTLMMEGLSKVIDAQQGNFIAYFRGGKCIHLGVFEAIGHSSWAPNEVQFVKAHLQWIDKGTWWMHNKGSLILHKEAQL